MTSETGEKFLRRYNGELTNKCLVESSAKIKAAFPNLPPEFFSIILERFIEKGFSDDRLIDSVNHVIDNCQYPTPTMSQFLSFDKKSKLLTYHEMLNKVNELGDIWKYYKKIKIDNSVYWFKKEDI